MKNIETWCGSDMYVPFTHDTSKKELRNSSSQLSWIKDAYFFDKTDDGISSVDYNRDDVTAGSQGLYLGIGLESGLSTGLPIIGHKMISRLLVKVGISDENMNEVDLGLFKGRKGVSFFDGSQHLGTCL